MTTVEKHSFLAKCIIFFLVTTRLYSMEKVIPLPTDIVHRIARLILNDYCKKIILHQKEVVAIFNSGTHEFDMNDPRIIPQQKLTFPLINKQWNRAFTDPSVIDAKQKLSCKEKYFQIVRKITLDDVNSFIFPLNPWIYISFDQINNYFKPSDTAFLALKNETDEYRSIFKFDDKNFNLWTFAAFKLTRLNEFLLPHYPKPIKQFYCLFFQLFFTESIDQSRKNIFFNYLINRGCFGRMDDVFNSEKIIKIAVNARWTINIPQKNFWELSEKIYYLNDSLKESVFDKLGYNLQYSKQKQQEYNDFFNTIVQDCDETKKELACLIQIDKAKGQLKNNKMLFMHILRNLDRQVEKKFFITFPKGKNERGRKKNSIDAITILNKVIFSLKTLLGYQSHESVADKLGLERYQDTYHTLLQTGPIYYSCLTEGINPGYTFYNAGKVDIPLNKVLSLLSARLFQTIKAQSFIGIEVDEVLKKYPDAVIQDPEIIVMLLEEIFYAKNQAIDQTVSLLQAFKITNELSDMISKKKILLAAMKIEYERLITLALMGYKYVKRAKLLKQFIPEFYE